MHAIGLRAAGRTRKSRAACENSMDLAEITEQAPGTAGTHTVREACAHDARPTRESRSMRWTGSSRPWGAFRSRRSSERTGWTRMRHADARSCAAAFRCRRGAASFAASAWPTRGSTRFPTGYPPRELLTSNPELVARYRLAMIFPPTTRNFLNTTFVNVPALRAAQCEPAIGIHSDDAAARGVVDGLWSRCSTTAAASWRGPA